MGVLESVLQFREQEKQNKQADINAIGSSVSNFLALKQQNESGQLENILKMAQIEKAKGGIEVNSFLKETEILKAAQDHADITGDSSLLTSLKAKARGRSVQGMIDINLEPAIAQSTRVEEFISSPLQNIPDFETTGSGRKLTEKGEVQKSLFLDKQKSDVALEKQNQGEVNKKGVNIEMGKLVSQNNLANLTGVIKDFTQVYADAIREGGAGGIIQSKLSETANAIGDLPFGIEVGGKFPASGALEGKRQELILKMMPMLTQQATKAEGSIRLIQGVLDAIGVTIPDGTTAIKTADRQLSETLSTFFRFARSAELLGNSFDDIFKGRDINDISDDEISDWAKSVKALTDTVNLDEEEIGLLDNLTNEALSPIRGNKDKKDGKTSTGNSFRRL